MAPVPLPAIPAVDPEGVTIREAAALVGLTVETIRYYERERITLEPTPRGPNGWRRYTESDIAWLAGVVMLRGTGMTVQELRAFAETYRSSTSEKRRLELLQSHRTRVLARLAETRTHLETLNTKIAAYEASIEKCGRGARGADDDTDGPRAASVAPTS